MDYKGLIAILIWAAIVIVAKLYEKHLNHKRNDEIQNYVERSIREFEKSVPRDKQKPDNSTGQVDQGGKENGG